MERFVPARDSYYDPEHPVDSDDDEEPLGGWNLENPPLVADEEPREPIPSPTYTEADLYPTIPDPRSGDPEWPLACYWPVYVSNFRLDDLAEDARNAQVGKFFAAKGLLVRMIFILEPEGCCYYYRQFQKVSMLFDMLVYFTSEEDAARAIRLCHRLTYYGHRLNVWPGRTPVYFDNSRSIRFRLSTRYCAEKPETIIEMILRKHHGPCIATVAMFDKGDVVVEFTNVESMRAAVSNIKHWVPKELLEATKKQRYLEGDVEAELLKAIADKPGFLDMVPPKEVLQQLLAGRIPDVDRSWENVAKPRDIPESAKEKFEFARNKGKQRLLRNAERKRRGKRNVLLDGGAPPIKKPLSIKAKRAIVRQEAERILGHGQSSADRYKFSMLDKKHKYERMKRALLDAFKNREPRRTSKELKELFYNMLAFEEELMDRLPQCEEYFGCLQLGNGLSKAVLIAGYGLPFPVCPSPETVEEFYEDVSPRTDGKVQVPESIPTVRPYSTTDLNPTILDPGCEPNWPLANLWPVYVDNFQLNTLNVARRDDQIHNYFAAKGLLAKQIFIHDNPPDFYYISYQKRLALVDMLVYFTSQEDAQRAIQLCHRDSYYGHYLNVFPGREPLYYDFNRSGFCKLKHNSESKLAEHPRVLWPTYIEENILEVLPQDVSCVTRHEHNFVHFELVQRDRLENILPRLSKEFRRKFRFVSKPQRKQRYLESDMKDQIKEKLLADPLFTNAQPKPELLEALFAGSVSSELINWNWYGWLDPRKPGMHLKLYERIVEFNEPITDVLQIWQEMQKID